MLEPEQHRLLTVETTRHADRCLIAPVGDLDMSTAEELEDAVRAAETSDAQRIIIDLSGMTFIDSSGLQLLLQADARSRANSKRLRLIRGPRRVQRVFELTNTEQLLPFLD